MALSIYLQEAGQFTAAEWSETLGEEIKSAQLLGDPDDGSTYYRHVLATLERLVSEKGLTSRKKLHERRQNWEDAYRNTPHGEPVVLSDTQIKE